MHFATRQITPHMSVSSLSYGTEARVRPGDRAPVLLLQIPRSGSATTSYGWGSSKVDALHYALINPAQMEQMHCSAEFEALVVRIALSRVVQGLSQALGRLPSKPLEFMPQVVQGTPEWDTWAPVVAAVQAIDRTPTGHFPEATLQALEQMVVSTLVYAQSHNFSDHLQSEARGLAPRHVRKAEEYIHASLHTALTTEEVARHAQVSVRALFNGFREFRNCTPAEYVRHARLAGARDDLRQGLLDHEGIAALARRWGYQHPGHFAAQYRLRYGESPLDTFRLR